MPKRAAKPKKKGGAKKGKRNSEMVDLDSDMSSEGEMSNQGNDEVLIAGHDMFDDDPAKLPEELLKALIKPAGQLIMFGLVNWEESGRKVTRTIDGVTHLWLPYKFKDVRCRLAVSHCSSAHSILVSENGKAMTFGRNNNGQLGLGDTKTRNIPEEIPELIEHNIIGAATGRNHSLFLTDRGTVYACGENKHGQCGIGQNTAQVLKPQRINYRGPPIIKVGCGADFSVILDIKGGLYTFGLPEYGQLGHNSDGKYFVTANKLAFNSELSPKKVILFIEKARDQRVTPVEVSDILDFACGHNHTIAIDSKKRAFTWGFGGYGRLGHNETKDEMVPRLVKAFDMQAKGIKMVACGSTYTFAVSELGTLFMMGTTKKTGEANMYPKPVADLAGWNVKHLACGFSSAAVYADDTLIVWGGAPAYGELGLGTMQKSSARPKTNKHFEDIRVHHLSMGLSHTLVIADDSTPELTQAIDKLEDYPL